MRLHFIDYLHRETGAVKRARTTTGHVEPLLGDGSWAVMFEDSENLHEVELEESGGEWRGDCWDIGIDGSRRRRCPGLQFNDGPCAHLFFVWSWTAGDDPDVQARESATAVRADGGVETFDYVAGGDGRVFGRPEDQL